MNANFGKIGKENQNLTRGAIQEINQNTETGGENQSTADEDSFDDATADPSIHSGPSSPAKAGVLGMFEKSVPSRTNQPDAIIGHHLHGNRLHHGLKAAFRDE